MNRKKKEQERRKATREYCDQTHAHKTVLDPAIFQDTPMGKLAIELAGDEPAHELFTLLFNITHIAMADVTFDFGEGVERMGYPEIPLMFEKPFYPRTMEIVKRLVDNGYLRLEEENARGAAYVWILSEEHARMAWVERALGVIQGYKPLFKSKATNPFTHQEQIRLMGAFGIPVGATFDFQLLGDFHFQMALTPSHLHVSKQVEPVFVQSAMVFWMLQAFANKHGLGEFSRPMPDSEMLQVAPVVEELGKSIYNTMPVEDMIVRFENEFRNFWKGFVKGKVLETVGA